LCILLAPGLYELTPGRLTNFRPATGIGRVNIEREGERLTLRSRWGDYKRGVELLPVDANDPLIYAVLPEDGETYYFIFTRGADGRIDGLRCDRLVRMLKVG
jgi:hypothetical protein